MIIRKRTYASGKVKWVLDKGKVAGRRVQIAYDTAEEAKGKLADAKAQRRNEGEAGLTLSAPDRVRFVEARDQLAAAGATISEAVAYFLKHHKPAGDAISLRALLTKCEREKERLGKSPRYVQQFRCSCLSFIRGREEVNAHDVKRPDVKDWLAGNQWAPKTQDVYLGDLRALFSFAIEEGHARENPCKGVEIAAHEETVIGTMTVQEANQLLTRAALVSWHGEEDFRELLPYAVLGLFCGIRPAELSRLDESALSIAELHVIVAAKIAKTRRRRVVDISENARQWLALVSPISPGPIMPKNFRRRWARLRMAAGWRPELQALSKTDPRPDPALPEWPHDVMRHTFASMHYAQHQNESLLKAQLGHSQREEVLFRHYRAMKTRAEAAAFWALVPTV